MDLTEFHVRFQMPSFTMQGEVFGRLAGDAILKKAATRTELKRMVATFQIFMDATAALKRREQGEEAAAAFKQAALAALVERIALYAQQDEQISRLGHGIQPEQ
jgi:hypothetical protein